MYEIKSSQRFIFALFMWHKTIAAGKGFLTRLGDFIRRKHYNETVVTSILTWIPYIVGSVVTALVAILYAKIFDYINHLSHLVKDNISWLFRMDSPISFLLFSSLGTTLL